MPSGFLTTRFPAAPLLAGALAAGALLVASLLAISPARAAADTNADDGPVVLVVGDSLSAAYGIAERDGWVALAGQALAEDYPGIAFVNASISGDTTVGGLRRLPDALERFEPDVVVIELGGNDGLRAYPTDAMQENLTRMATLAEDSGAQALILGMLIPSNYGRAYLERFSAAFGAAAEASDAGLVPFFLESIATDRNFFQRDGIHPTEAAQPLMMEHVLPALRETLDEAAAS